ERSEVPSGLARPFRPWREILRARRARGWLEVRLDPDGDSLSFDHAPKYGGRVEPFLEHVVEEQARSRTTIVVSQQASRLSELLDEQGLHVVAREGLDEAPRGVELVHGLLREGWVSDALKVDLYTDSEIFGWTKQRRSAPTRRLGSER